MTEWRGLKYKKCTLKYKQNVVKLVLEKETIWQLWSQGGYNTFYLCRKYVLDGCIRLGIFFQTLKFEGFAWRQVTIRINIEPCCIGVDLF